MAGQTYFWDWTHGRRLYLDRLLDALAADPEAAAGGFFFDVVPYHLYFNPTQAPQVIGEVKAALARRGITGKEIWINETNAPPSDDPQELPWSAPRYRISLDEQAAFVIQQFSQAFAAGASRVEIYKLRNSADHPESIEPFGLLRADDSRRPAFDAYRAVTTYLRDFRGVVKQQLGDVGRVHLRSRRADDHRALDVGPDAGARPREGHRAGGAAGGRARPDQPDQSGGWQLPHRLAGGELRQLGGVRARHRRRAAAARWKPARRLAGSRSSRRRHRRPRARPLRRATSTATPSPAPTASSTLAPSPSPTATPEAATPTATAEPPTPTVAAATVTAGATSVATPPATPPAAPGRGPISVCALPIGAGVLAVGLAASLTARRAVSNRPKR